MSGFGKVGLMKKQKTFVGTTMEEVEEKAKAWLTSRKGKIVYSAPVPSTPQRLRELQPKWEVEVEYDEEEAASG
jgi:hypothetical protein